MAKAQKRKAEEPVTISKIYEAIKARDFIQDLWCDLIVDIQEKPTYKRIKDMVNTLINNGIEDFSDDPWNEDESLKRRKLLTEISIMSYTVDTIITELLSKKLVNEFQCIIENMVREIEPGIAPSQSAGPSNLNGNQSESTSLPSRTSPASSSDKVAVRKRGRPKKGITVANQANPISNQSNPISNQANPVSNQANRTPQKRGRPRKIPRPGELSSSLSPKNTTERPKPSSLLNNEGDAESVISDGDLSITSVSSVHTSELSSFEDTISIDGEEDGEKEQIPLKIANELYLKGALSQIYRLGKKAEDQTKTNDIFSADENSQSSLSYSSSQKILPQRIRKPNSKYSSDSMICETYQVVDLSSPEKEKTVVQARPSPKKLK